MIRVLHVLGGLNVGGAESMIMNLYRNIDRNKIQFDFVIHNLGKQDFEDEVIAMGGKIYRFPPFNGANLIKVIKLWNAFFREHKEYKILHSHVRSYAVVYFVIAKYYSVTTIIHSHSTSNGHGIKSIVKFILQYPLRFLADYFIGCSKEAGEWLFGKKVVDSSRYYMLPNAIDLRNYKFQNQTREQYRNDFKIKDKTVFLHVGRLIDAKNHKFLIEVFSEYLKINSNAVLLITGGGDLYDVIEQDIKQHNLTSNVFMLGSRNDVPNLLQAADCFLFPSKWEGLPVTVVEAQAAGLPCFVSNNVTNDVFISELAIPLPINQGIGCWVSAMSHMTYKRLDVSENIIKAGFEIKQTVKWLENLYWRLDNDKVYS